jgi:hypothetical protein
MAGDNQFRLDVNGVTKVDKTTGSENFNLYHLIPIVLGPGTNYLVFRAIGDGTTSDMFAAAIYDNTSAQLSAATSDTQLNIIFDTADLVGETLQIGTCPSGWFLDTSGGAGAYKCKRFVTAPCSPIN